MKMVVVNISSARLVGTSKERIIAETAELLVNQKTYDTII